ncbi:MAG: 50S ribosomal protein L11, partial [Elusimicrobiota bacterium]
AALIKKAAGLAKGSGVPNKDKVGKLNLKQVEEVARLKLPDLNTRDVKKAIEMVKGAARSMGVDIVEE